jgi:type II secretory pathway component PulM
MDLRSREKKVVAVCGGLVLAAILHLVIISPSLKKRDDLDRSVARARIQLEELRLLEREYDQILDETRKIQQRMRERSRDFALFSFLDQTANRLDLKNNLTSMKPSRRTLDQNLAEDLVEMRLEGISLKNLVTYLYEIEKTGAAVAIANIRIQPESRLGAGLNVSMLVTSISST